MINTKKFTNNIQARYEELLNDPLKWGIMRNLAYASIRDDVEKIVKDTNENSADVYINAENLVQNLKSHSINQYIEAGSFTQEVNLSQMGQLNQVLMNTELFQTINIIKKEKIIERIDNLSHSALTSFLNNEYAVIAYIQGETEDKDVVTNSSFPTLEKMRLSIHKVIQKFKIITEYENLVTYKNNQQQYKTKTYTSKNQDKIFDSTLPFAIYEIEYNIHYKEPLYDDKRDDLLSDLSDLDDKNLRKILIVILNTRLLNLQNKKTVRTLDNNLFGQSIYTKENLSKLLGKNITKKKFDKGAGRIKKRIEILKSKNKLTLNKPVDILFRNM